MNDEQVIQLIRTGKSDRALDVLYKNFPAVRKLIRAGGGNSADAEDIFQESLIILVRKIRDTDFRLTAQLSTYLFSVCRFLWNDELKKRKRQPMTEPGTDEPAEQEWQSTREKEALAQLAEKALHQLQDRCRELLLLFYEGRWKLKDIAAKMGYSSESTAKNQKYKCLESAKNKLKELKQTTQTY